MKTKLFLFFTVFLMSFGMNAQFASVAVVGEAAGGWPTGAAGEIDVHQMENPSGDLTNWTLSGLELTNWDVLNGGGIKFRAENAWINNWGSIDFPSGIGISGGANIQCYAGTFDVEFNSTTGVYNFIGGTPPPVVKLVGACTGTVDGIVMAPSAANTFTATNVTLLDGAGQFSIDDVLFGEDGLDGTPVFPNGILTGASNNIPVVGGFYSSITLNIEFGDYTFVLAPVYPSIAIVGSGAGGWPVDPQIDANVLSTEDGETYTGIVTLTSDAPNNEIKFRSNNDWTQPNWGGGSFPTGPTDAAANIVVTTAGTYDVVFTRSTGAYIFSIPTIALVGSATPTGWPTGNPGEIDATVLSTLDGASYFLSSVDLIGGLECKFRTNNAWDVNFGAVEFPLGVGTQGGANIAVTTTSTYSVSLNRVTGEYVFTDLLSATSFNKNTFKVYPNPTNTSWNFVSTSDKNITSIQIVDMLGKTVMTINPAATSANVDATSITSGLYFAKVTTTSGTETLKLMKN